MEPAAWSGVANAPAAPGALAVRDGVVARPALFHRLAQAQRVAEVSAPPGSGKTILLRSWIAECGLAGRVAKTEQHTIEDMLRVQHYNRAATARALGISRVTLYNKIRKYGIQLPARVTAWE